MKINYHSIQKQIIIIVTLALLLLDFTYMFWYLEYSIKSSASKNNQIEFVLEESWNYKIDFSHTQGFYEDYFDLSMHTDTGYTIRYTTDTRMPTGKSQEYTGPVSLHAIASEFGKKSTDGTHGVVIRAGLFNGEDLVSSIYSNTYIFGSSISERHSLPVIFLVTEHENLFSSQGIYTRFDSRGKQYEKPVYIDFVSPDGTVEFSQNAGIRIFGSAMRGLPLKSFRLTARNEYETGKDMFYYEFFPGLMSKTKDKYVVDSFKHLILRNAGNDYNGTMFRDALMQRISAGAGIDFQQYRPVSVYVNGEYWGIMNLREFLNNDYVATHYNLDSSKITILTNNLYDGGPRFGERDFTRMISQVRRQNMADQTQYEEIQKMMDTDNFIRYCAVQVYLANNDWPHNNVRLWKYNTFDGEYDENAQYGADGLFRWMLKDTDFGFGLVGQYNQDTLGWLISNNELFRSLMKNEQFARDYVNITCDFLNDIFLPEKVIDEINNVQLGIAAEIPYHLDRWKDSAGGSEARWNSNIAGMRRFSEQRPDFVLRYLKKHFSLKNEIQLSVVRSEGGYVIVNSIDLSKTKSFILNNYWSGTYFQDVPVNITAVAYPGYEFAGWEKSSDNASFIDDQGNPFNRVVLTGDSEIQAIFRKINPEAEVPNLYDAISTYQYPVTEAAKNRVLIEGDLLDESIRPLIQDGIVYLCIDDINEKTNLRFSGSEDFVIDDKRYVSAEKFAARLRSKFYWSDVYQSVIISK